MFGSEILEVAIGLIFIYILMSVICAAIREVIEAKVKSRAAYLEHGIRELLHDKDGQDLAASLYKHPLIYSLFASTYTPGETTERPGLFASGGNLPSYIPAKNFALALMDMAVRGRDTDAVSSDPNAPAITIETLRTNVLNLGNHAVQRVLLIAIDSARGDIELAQKNIEAWFESAMDRVSGWYKRSTQWIVFFIGLGLAIGLNVNTIVIGDYLYKNQDARKALVARAEIVAKDPKSVETSDAATKELNKARLPIGWDGWRPLRCDEPWQKWDDVAVPILGWLLTALAASMGAPFWFDVLNKVMVIRSTVKPHEKSKEEASEDRQLKPGKTQTTVVAAPLVQESAAASPPPSPPASASIPTPRDAESNIDGCDVPMAEADPTADEDLPEAEGGVQS
jgi:hypothetical protein